jgi:hypothetical protein
VLGFDLAASYKKVRSMICQVPKKYVQVCKNGNKALLMSDGGANLAG